MSTNDAKLTTKQRKKLSSKSFCGPERSFPAHDCKHVKAGLSLLGRYKGPGSKAKIRACLYRKARSLNCFKSGPGAKKKDFEAMDILMESVSMFDENALCYEEVVSSFVTACEKLHMSKTKVASILGYLHDEDLDSALILLLQRVV